MIPEFESNGFLPKDVYEATWQEITDRYGLNAHRRRLLDGLKEALMSLKAAGCRTVYIDGSFVTSKELPLDFDACWDDEDVDLELLDPALLEFGDERSAQKERFFGELFPNRAPAAPNGMNFFEYFQIDKGTGEQKGIIKLNLEDLTHD